MRLFQTATVLFALLVLHPQSRADEEPGSTRPRPNFILILADDLGWQDVKCYDIDEPSPMETPHIDALAKRGVLFREAYSPAPTCTPSRCAIMSGVHPARAQTTHVSGGSPPHGSKSAVMIAPWYSGRMPAEELTLAKILRNNGYATGLAGIWHMAVDHHAFPGPTDQGFDSTTHRKGSDVRGVQTAMKNRLDGFATEDPDDPYHLDSEGFPTDPVTIGGLEFMERNRDKPFFLYYATWLVHTPIQSRGKRLLEKYCKKLQVPYPDHPTGWSIEGQKNPYYCAMVETLDHYVGQIVRFLETTDDLRWPGHKLIENSYLFFTSDNGGMEGGHGEVITDNAPLDQGKMSAKEGGVRVAFLASGPGIQGGVQSDVMINGLDLYPTIVSLAGIPQPPGKRLDGANLAPLLTGDPTTGSLVRGPDGKQREDMIWHYPHGGRTSFQSTIRSGDFKLIKNHDRSNPAMPACELYRLFSSKQGKHTRNDIEEMDNLSSSMPAKVAELDERLMAVLSDMKASFPHYNPDFSGHLPGKQNIPTVTGHRRDGRRIEVDYEEHGARVVRADIIFTTNGGQASEEWFRAAAHPPTGGRLTAVLPANATHYFLNLIDENNFLVSYPQPTNKASDRRMASGYALSALPVKDSTDP
jgi:arylsulfatase A-like enzyme